MKTANHYILEQMFHRFFFGQAVEGIDFLDIDPDDPEDLRRIVDCCLRPYVEKKSPAQRNLICWTLEYYAFTGSAPFDVLRNRAQDLDMADPESWLLFFRHVGEELFGAEFSREINVDEYHEENDRGTAEWAFYS